MLQNLFQREIQRNKKIADTLNNYRALFSNYNYPPFRHRLLTPKVHKVFMIAIKNTPHDEE